MIIGLFASFIIPSLHITYDVVTVSPPTVTPLQLSDAFESPTLSKVSEVEVFYSAETPVVTPKTTNTFLINMDTIWTIVFILYLAGVIVLIFRELYAYIRLMNLYKKGKRDKILGYTVIDTPKIASPFTTFNVIFADLNKLQGTSKESIIAHEIVHIKQKHWIDLLLSEIVLIIEWFNPVVWLYVRYQKENHEYLADKGVLDQGISPSAYKAALVNERMQGQVFKFVNSFKGSEPLSRFSMMKKKKSPIWKRAFALTIIPLLGAFLWVSATPNFLLINFDNFSFRVINEVKMVDKNGYPIGNTISFNDMLALTKLSGYEYLIPSSLRNAKMDLYLKTGTNGTLVVETRANGKKGKGSIANTDMIDKVLAREDVIILIDGNASSEQDLRAIDLKNISSLTYLYNDRMFSQVGSQITVSSISDYGINSPKIVKTDDLFIIENADIFDVINQLKEPLVIINGETSSLAALKGIKQNNITVLSVYTKKEHISKYGSNGRNGVILATTNIPS
ncbi:MAG: M56 family metallopeptidase [Dysgonomonas sp.]